MEPTAIGIIGIAVLLVLIFAGMPVGIAMILVGFLGYTIVDGLNSAFYQLGTIPFTQIANPNLTMLPLFMLMSAIAVEARISGDLYQMAHKWIGQIRGGLAMATVFGCAAFAAVANSEFATAAAIGKAAFPEMKKYNYDERLASGCIAAGGTIGVMIPPSVGFIFYGLLTNESIGRLFIAGILPGLIEAALFMAAIYLMCTINPKMGPAGPKTTFKEKLVSLKGAGPMAALFLIVIGGIYAGVFTPTEAGAIGAAGAFLIGFVLRRLTRKGIIASFLETGRITGMVGILLVGAMIFSTFMSVTKIPITLADFIAGLEVNRYIILVGMLVFYIIIGCLIDVASAIILTLPILFPMVLAMGFDPIWYGVLMVLMMEMGVITPPFGIVILGLSGVINTPMGTIFRGVLPFVAVYLVIIALLVAFPQISLWLPNMMKG